MRNKTFLAILSLPILLSLHSCTDEWNLAKDITTEINFSPDGFSLAGESTIDIPLEQVLKIKNNIAVDSSGNYMFKLSKEMDTTKVNIGQGSLCNAIDTFREVALDKDPSVVITPNKKYPNYGKLEFSSTISPNYHGDGLDGLKKSICNLFYIYTPMTIDIQSSFANLDGVYSIDELRYEIPSFYDLEDESDLVETGIDISSEKTHMHYIHIKGVNLSKTDLRPGEIATVDQKTHRIMLAGEVTMKATAKSIDINKFKASQSPMLGYHVFIGNLGTTHVIGKFNNKEDIAIKPITFDDIPDFLRDDSVIIDVENPQVHMTLDNEVPAKVAMNAIMTGVKNDKNISTLYAGDEFGTDSIVFFGADNGNSKRTNVWITRIPTPIPDSVSRNVVIDSVNKLIRQIPDKINIKATAKTDSTQVVELSLDHEYNAIPHYEIVAPMKIGKDMKIVYSKNITDLHKTLKSFRINSFELDGNATNNIPLSLRFDVKTYDKNDSLMDLTVETPDSIPGYGKDIPIKITLSDGKVYDVSDIDRIYLRIYAVTNNGLVGQYLNKNQNLRLENVKATIKGEEE